jgi:hypothetical protein
MLLFLSITDYSLILSEAHHLQNQKEHIAIAIIRQPETVLNSSVGGGNFSRNLVFLQSVSSREQEAGE